MNRRILQFALLLLTSASAFAAGPAPTRTVYDATLRNGFTIHHLRHEYIGNNTRLYTTETSYMDVPSGEIAEMNQSEETLEVAAPPKDTKPAPTLDEVVSAASGKHQIDPDLITSVIHAESGFNPRALSPKGAQGLMQLMPGTANKLGVANAYDPAANVDGGTQYLRELLLRYNGDVAKALAAYNAGPGRVAQYHGVPPYYETRTYVARVIRDFNRKKLAAQKQASTKKSAPTSTASAAPATSTGQ